MLAVKFLLTCSEYSESGESSSKKYVALMFVHKNLWTETMGFLYNNNDPIKSLNKMNKLIFWSFYVDSCTVYNDLSTRSNKLDYNLQN